jgi:hypothetical protein
MDRVYILIACNRKKKNTMSKKRRYNTHESDDNDDTDDEDQYHIIDYRPLDMMEMKRMMNLYRTSAILRTVMGVIMRNVTSGGVIFDVKGFKSNPDRCDFHNTVWSSFIRTLVLNLYVYGIAVCTFKQSKKHGGSPCCVDMDSVNIFMKMDIHGRRKYVVCQNTTATLNRHNTHHNTTHMGEEMQDVIVWESDPPNKDGTMASIIACIATDIESYTEIENAHRATMTASRNCDVLIEQQSRTMTSENLDPGQFEIPIAPNSIMTGVSSEHVNFSQFVRDAHMKNRGIDGVDPTKTESAVDGIMRLTKLPMDCKVGKIVERTMHSKLVEEMG